MNYTVSFSVGLAHDIYRPGDVTIESVALLDRIKKMVHGSTPINQYIYNVCSDWADSGLNEAFALLLDATNKKPVADLKCASDHPDKYYPVQVERVPTEDELNKSRLLLLVPGDSVMTGHSETDSNGTYLITGVRRTKKSFLWFQFTRAVDASFHRPA
jgi:hypothetical protein